MAAKERLFGRRADRFTLSEFALLSLLLGVAGEESIQRQSRRKLLGAIGILAGGDPCKCAAQ